MIAIKLKEKILQLPKEDKEEIIQIIWDQLDENNVTLSKEHQEILDKRYESYLKGQTQFKNWNDVKKEILCG